MTWINDKTDIVNWTKISDKTGDIFISQAEKRLTETIETFNYFSKRTEQLATILIGTIPSIIIFLGSNKINYNYLQLTAILMLVPLSFSAYFLFPNFFKISQLNVRGFEPKDIAVTQYIDNNFTKEQQTANLTLWICEDIQRRINLNTSLNQERKHNYLKAIKSLLFIIPCPLIAALLLYFFQHNSFLR